MRAVALTTCPTDPRASSSPAPPCGRVISSDVQPGVTYHPTTEETLCDLRVFSDGLRVPFWVGVPSDAVEPRTPSVIAKPCTQFAGHPRLSLRQTPSSEDPHVDTPGKPHVSREMHGCLVRCAPTTPRLRGAIFGCSVMGCAYRSGWVSRQMHRCPVRCRVGVPSDAPCALAPITSAPARCSATAQCTAGRYQCAN